MQFTRGRGRGRSWGSLRVCAVVCGCVWLSTTVILGVYLHTHLGQFQNQQQQQQSRAGSPVHRLHSPGFSFNSEKVVPPSEDAAAAAVSRGDGDPISAQSSWTHVRWLDSWLNRAAFASSQSTVAVFVNPDKDAAQRRPKAQNKKQRKDTEDDSNVKKSLGLLLQSHAAGEASWLGADDYMGIPWHHLGLDVHVGGDRWRMHGELGLDRNGGRVWTQKAAPPPDLDMTAELKAGQGFNLRLSDSLPLDRNATDFRDPVCLKSQRFDISSLAPLSASIVMTFFNEPLSTLLRSVHSVLNRTPPPLLKEILLVDDCSDAEGIYPQLSEAVAVLPKTKIVRLGERRGLMGARLEGAVRAEGRVVVVLDSHIETQPGWLEPLLEIIRQDRKNVAMPVIDSIEAETFRFSATSGIGCQLDFKWTIVELSRLQGHVERADPIPSAVMAGGLFAVDREWFFELGGYDKEMRFWGAENVEFSFRLWMCGGRLLCAPCSRVFHVFRKGGLGYTVPQDDLWRNRLRAAVGWMDEYAEIPLTIQPRSDLDLGRFDEIIDLRRRLQCHSFGWYLSEVASLNFIRSMEDVPFVGPIRSVHSGRCLDSMGHTQEGPAARIGVFPCHGQGGTQAWFLTRQGTLRPSGNDALCVEAPDRLRSCDGLLKTVPPSVPSVSSPVWSLEGKQLVWGVRGEGKEKEGGDSSPKEKTSVRCLALQVAGSKAEQPQLALLPCDPSEATQQWDLDPFPPPKGKLKGAVGVAQNQKKAPPNLRRERDKGASKVVKGKDQKGRESPGNEKEKPPQDPPRLDGPQPGAPSTLSPVPPGYTRLRVPDEVLRASCGPSCETIGQGEKGEVVWGYFNASSEDLGISGDLQTQGARPGSFHGFLGALQTIGGWQPHKENLKDMVLNMSRELETGGGFNLRLSDALPLDRHVRDSRDAVCLEQRFDWSALSGLSASIVMTFFNEPLSTLLRSVHSVLNRTPPPLLKEIVLVDDCSDAEGIYPQLSEAVEALPKTKIVRLGERRGLMGARLEGAVRAEGRVVVVLDSHIETQPGWLEPLLEIIRQDRKNVAMPIIDTLKAEDFSFDSTGGIGCRLDFRWSIVEQASLTAPVTRPDPIASPVMAGGLFAVERDWFFELGGYDKEMRFWGAENVEFSFRLWMCGGRLLCAPCSRVFHVFRKGGLGYTVPQEALHRNKRRTAAGWMDEFAPVAQAFITGPPVPDIGPLDEIRELRSRLQCHPFSWYLREVATDNPIRSLSEILFLGEVRSLGLPGQCLDSLGNKEAGKKGGLFGCHGQRGTQGLLLSTLTNQLMLLMNERVCWDAPDRLRDCKEMTRSRLHVAFLPLSLENWGENDSLLPPLMPGYERGRLEWREVEDREIDGKKGASLCLTTRKDAEGQGHLEAQPCSEGLSGDLSQIWDAQKFVPPPSSESPSSFHSPLGVSALPRLPPFVEAPGDGIGKEGGSLQYEEGQRGEEGQENIPLVSAAGGEKSAEGGEKGGQAFR
uniref:Protein-UDP acetylgalactosaminyltransferase 7 n=1 Tax=Chromera velia CCMP2878 TaxID=1169474 RepID=A0A0G4FZ43_9ALVE|eukprot:Cvel_3912.t1-p1 / transcript=Cvel_3912.t1 / gene=Cvel_3912 / organism=Chromera_velia_CCMP2878 / gene_product=Polypeptide N-acetylgalactosaminyltransferase 4, putative / transcript_product=Polypeptide N-acetylgalactosaminyltransferase 4, putative / location=Cvel_scaffold166:5185-17620(-) / protein_length=1488 / sequence_SO=supercontig / SO=protein_coding / is_pseudo=false